MDREVRYHKSTGSIILKPNTVTYVDDSLVTAKELTDCYGNRISVMSKELVEEYIANAAPVEVEDEVLEDELEENDSDEGVIAGGAAPISTNELENEGTGNGSDEDTQDSTEEDLTSNTGDKDVDDFLNGETTIVPEGTQEIDEEEALKLQKEAEGQAVKKAQDEAKTPKAKASKTAKATTKKGAKKK